MKFALVGYGRMGREIERVAEARGHRLAAIVDPHARGPRARASLDARALRGVEVAFEFTRPASAERNVIALLARDVAVVCGTTGWDASSRALRDAAKRSKAGVVAAPNFSPGVALFYRAVERAARLYLARPGYDAFVLESHHRAKKDAPSGTAKVLAGMVGDPPVASVRAGHEAGTHTVGFDGEHDQVVLTHRSRGRSGFALGAVLAAEWLRGRRGWHGFDEVVDAMVRAAKGGRR